MSLWKDPMSRNRTITRLLAVLAVVAFGRGCGDGGSPTRPSTPESARPTTVTVSPATAELSALGAVVQLTAEVRDQNARVMPAETVTWSSRDTSVATVDGTGLVTAAGNGQATISAAAGSASGSASGSAEVTVTQLVTSVQVSPSAATVALGGTLQMEAEGLDENGVAVEGAEFVWGSSDAAIATADASGLVTGVGAGTATIAATAGDGQGTAQITVTDPQRAALEALYEATDGPNWTNANNWLTDAPLGEWYRVATDAAGRVVGLDLDGNGLSGPIPAELGNLSSLTELELQHNRLSGPIPAELGKLSNLRILSLTGNGLSGPIPPELAQLSSLLGLWLRSNNLTGPIPAEFGNLSSLIWLVLDSNGLTGPVPKSMLRMDGLKTFTFGGNAGLCAPGTSEFVSWLRVRVVDSVEGPYCNESDTAVLEVVYETTGGPNWINADGWLETPALEAWYGVATDSLGHVVALDLARNGLEGRLPATLGNLAGLATLRIGPNALSGRLPLTLVRLDLVEFNYAGTGLCAPTDASFQSWLSGIPSREGTGVECGPMSGREVLEVLYDATGGRHWANAHNWLTDAPLGEWYGVDADAYGRVIALDLSFSALSGPIPSEIGNLRSLTALDLSANELSGPLPAELGNLSNLRILSLTGNGLSGPIPSELGNLTNLTSLGLGSNDLSGAIPPELGNLANLTALGLPRNELSGPIPSELGNLANLTSLGLGSNDLSGAIPPELGNLANLRSLELDHNDLTGLIPVELGTAANLRALLLHANSLSGPIPPAVGNLTRLVELHLNLNGLSGKIPPELGNLASLQWLFLDNNGLTGQVPDEFGGLSSLLRLTLGDNSGLSGPLPASLTGLSRLEVLTAGGTGLCAPGDAGFQAWLEGVVQIRVAACASGGPGMAYLTQAVQSREYPVPLVAGEKALLRVFVTAAGAGGAGIPPVRAWFYLNGTERHVVDIPAASTPIPTEIDESNLSSSANKVIPGEIVQPGLEMVIEIDPDRTLDPGLGVGKRIPETGRMALDVREMPVFDLTVIPFLWSADPNREVVEAVEGMAADPVGHELLWATHTLLPTGGLEVSAHEPVLSSTNNAHRLLDETIAIQAIEGGRSYYMGMMSGPVTGAGGVAPAGPSRTNFSIPHAEVIAHEFGHNLGLAHAPCGATFFVDGSFPYPEGSTGAWGYDFRDGGFLVSPERTYDLMSYCRPKWISDYYFTSALRFRLLDERTSGTATAPAQESEALLLWGGKDEEGEPFLNPAFVVVAQPTLPNDAGEHRITGRTGSGEEVFALGFDMPKVADGNGSSSFAFVLPVEPGWADNLASITLSGPGGAVTLNGDTDLPMSILLDPNTGQVRGILRDVPQADIAAALAPRARPDSLDVLFSRGIPDAGAWGR